MGAILGIIALAVLLYFLLNNKKKRTVYSGPVPASWKTILNANVNFYSQLTPEEKLGFESRLQHFLNTTRITGIKTQVELIDRLLIAASAIIPVFAFPAWEYINLKEVLLYPGSFNEKYEFEANDAKIVGMVGSGYMEGKMILSRPALRAGFRIDNDKKNVGIHEFTHLIDKADGKVDGIPELLLDKQYVIPWLNMVQKNMEEIHRANSDINPYGGVAPEEFFSVIAEYFFERPKLLQEKHPKLYSQLSEIFSVKLAHKYVSISPAGEIGRNDPCPCGSTLKFKKCCGMHQVKHQD